MEAKLPQTSPLTPAPSLSNDSSELYSAGGTDQQHNAASLAASRTQDPTEPLSSKEVFGTKHIVTDIDRGEVSKAGATETDGSQSRVEPTGHDPEVAMSVEDMDDKTYWEDLSRFRYQNFFLGRSSELGDSRRSKFRFVQSMIYWQLTEERIVELEKKMRQVLREKSPVDEDDNAGKNVPGSNNNYNLLSWADFSAPIEVDPKQKMGRWQHHPEMDNEPKHVVELLMDKPRTILNMYIKRDSSNPDSQLSTCMQAIASSKGPATGPAQHQPYRIRIRSRPLLKVLKAITNCQTTIGPHEHRLVLIRPFKLLVAFAEKIQEHFDKVERDHRMSNLGVVGFGVSRDNDGRRVAGPEMRPQTEAEANEAEEAREHLRVLCDVIKTYLQPQLQLQQGLTADVPKVSFDDLWYLYKPGYEIRTSGSKQIQLYRVLKVTCGRGMLSFGEGPSLSASKKLKKQGWSDGSFVIECFYIHYDGVRFGPVNKTFQIQKYESKKDVRSLPVYPIQCDPNADETRRNLEERGERFCELSNPKSTAHRKYRGLTLDKNREQVDSEVIIDFGLAFIRMKDEKPEIGVDELVDDDKRELSESVMLNTACSEAGCCGNDIIYNDYEVDAKERSEFKENNKQLFESREDPYQLSSEHRRLLPPMVYGFTLRTRKWATFDISILEMPDYDNSNWADLVVDPHTKDTVLALVENHERPGNTLGPKMEGVLSSVELVQGKGRGLIILLHGEPGVGKTSTAECVAAYTKRPLFPVTCGDIGEKATDVEENLEKNFQLAHKWGCVLLLDEADIFLSTRNEVDVQHNAIVSIFLRTLEYYSGILFLTTNRVGKIDRAFMSRIHLSLYYPKLNQDSTLRIWRNNLKRVGREFKKEKKEIQFNTEQLIRFAKHHFRKLDEARDLTVWNGRQIRNAFQTAIAMATYEAKETNEKNKEAGIDQTVVPVLRRSHFRDVARSARRFDKYLHSVVGGRSGAEVALESKWRDDEFMASDVTDAEEDRHKTEQKKRKKKHKKEKKNAKHRSRSGSISGEDESRSSCSESGDERSSKRRG